MTTTRRLFALFLVLLSASGLCAEKISLQDAIHRALAKNFAIQSSSFDVSIANAAVSQQLGIFDPQLTGNFNNSYNEIPQLADPLTGLRPDPILDKDASYSLGLNGLMPWGMTYSLSATSNNDRNTSVVFNDNFLSFAGVSGRQPLLRDFGVGATTAQIRIAMTNRSISEWQYRATLINTVTNVIFAYDDLNLAQAQLRSALNLRDKVAELVDENIKRNKVGSMSQYDVIQARSRLADSEDGILQARQFVHDEESALKALISDEHTSKLLDWTIEIEELPTPPLTTVNAALDFAEALKKRPDYRQAQLALERNDINYHYQRNQLLPRLDLVGSYGYNGYDTSDRVARQMIRNQDYRAYSYGVQVTVPLAFVTERARYRSSKLALQQSKTQLDSLEQDIVVAVGNGANHIENTYKRVEATRAARELGQQTLDAEVKRLVAGTGSTFNVLYQQELLTSLQFSEVNAINDYAKALADYDRQLGLTLEKLNITVVVPK
ncbi:MAG TPA: TolC family protein [Candidatus Didemnitutus sp.]|nr:TolC family protein [Candidatus Didemnitutus sp.]